MTEDDALLELLAQLQVRNYHFVAVTPKTHERVLSRERSATLTLRDIFGWNRPFRAAEIEPGILELLRRADAVGGTAGWLRSRVRVASLGSRLFLHSSFPTTSADSVFFGPDTYRFCAFVTAQLGGMSARSWIVDMGAGSGAGGIVAASAMPTARFTLVDSNPAAARLARINARFAGVSADIVISDRIPVGCDVVIANPPYMIDTAHRDYRDGGALFGGEVALDWARQALSNLTPGGTMLLYTGAAVAGGTSPMLNAISELAGEKEAALVVREIDPDVFGEELSGPEYAEVERIAAVGIRISRQ